jgi:hypothetical protein
MHILLVNVIEQVFRIFFGMPFIPGRVMLSPAEKRIGIQHALLMM